MKIACSTLPFRSYALGEALRKIVSFGLRRVEFCVDPRHSDPKKWKERPEEIKLLIEQSGLVLNSIHVPLPQAISDRPYDEIKEHWSRSTNGSIDLAAFLGAPFVVQHVGVVEMSTEGGQEIKSQRTLPDLHAVAEYATTRQIKIAVENAPSSTTRMLGASIGEITDFVDTLPDESVGICLDLSHCLACGRDPMEALKSVNIRRLLSVHASDNLSNQMEDVHLPIGAGDIPWKRILDILESLEFRGSFVVEVAEGKNGERALGDSLKFLRGIHRFDDWP